MVTPAVFGVYGKSKSGKTDLIAKIITRLSHEGYNVATIKKTDKTISLDTEGKDTWKHGQAGASLVVFSSPIETSFIIKKGEDIHTIIHHIAALGQYDILIIEGAADPTIPKIKVGDVKTRPNTIGEYHGDFTRLIEQIKNEIINHLQSDRKTSDVTVKVNGNLVPLTAFPSTMIRSTILGMLGSLKGVHEISEVDIHFNVVPQS
jgi:molybdopterin-guanine dinucleotide biosynthesis protein MobB